MSVSRDSSKVKWTGRDAAAHNIRDKEDERGNKARLCSPRPLHNLGSVARSSAEAAHS